MRQTPKIRMIHEVYHRELKMENGKWKMENGKWKIKNFTF